MFNCVEIRQLNSIVIKFLEISTRLEFNHSNQFRPGIIFNRSTLKKKNLIIPIVRRVLQLFQSVTIENVYIPITCGELGGMPYHHSGLSWGV